MRLHLLIFSCDEHVYALHLSSVERVVQALEITPIPESSPVLFGVFDLHGRTIPVISFRHLLALPEKKMDLEDVFIIVNVHDHQIALLTDQIIGVSELEKEESAAAVELFPELAMTHVVKYEELLIPLLDIDALIDREILHILHKEERGNSA